MIKKVSALLVVFCLLFQGFVIAADEKAIYEERLIAWLATVKSNQEGKEQRKMFINLVNYSKDYPKSDYVKDSEFIGLITLEGNNDYPLNVWEGFVKRNPNDKVSELTKSIFMKYLGSVPGSFNMPFSLVLLEVKGSDAFFNKKNYVDAVKYYSEFLKGVDFNDPAQKQDAFYFYKYLLTSYKNLGQQANFDETKVNVLSLYPEKSKEIDEFKF